mmetsp:Transcript_7899/g.24771  ORF Transcript_7899/g.24771 Transcript_7899/m.24771 type:complete len:199 (-) Transcript_7899:58-654(-)|eukprot:CAMPEP_0196775974 /NCGR_PEP_ID=MMETSP1104-20130614/4352_1 /TAXON_ID=33652 /ORGANISM="Cafeteria sp., Strain Caron Lab Isolate" /LENGTH=198 /DNA_ID=CAMNT_0042146145 /DNA_START=90 /DNA_END=686 /DNA_ORIENTATION=+
MSFTYGQKARELLLELKQGDWLPPYSDERVRQVIAEINALHADMLHTVQSAKASLAPDEPISDSAVICNLSVHNAAMQRNKRMLLAYLNHRAVRLRQMRWETGAVVPEMIKRNMSSSEREYFAAYDSLISEYMDEFELDLTADMKPPKDLYVEVRVMKDCGEIVTATGTVHLEMNTTHFLPRSDVEHLIRQGFLRQID